MTGVGTGRAAVLVIVGLAVYIATLCCGLFCLSWWSGRLAERLFRTWDLRQTSNRLAAEIYRAQWRYRAGGDIAVGAPRELP